MSKNYLIAIPVLLLSGAAMAQTEVPIFTETYGDIMGATKSITKRLSCHYDSNGRLVKRIDCSFNLDGTSSPVSDYTIVYDDNGRIKSEIKKQKKYDGTWSEPRYTNYEYNENGKLIRTFDVRECLEFLYEWDGDNMIRSEKNFVYSNGSKYTMENFTYSDFVEGKENMPGKIVSIGDYESSNYYGIYSYTVDGHIESYKTFTSKKNLAIREELYTYDEQKRCIEFLRKDSVYSVVNDVEVRSLAPVYKVPYIYENGKKMYTSYSCEPGSDEWFGTPINFIDSVGIIDSQKVPYELKLENASTSEDPNSVSVSWKANIEDGVNQSWVIRRDGVVIATVTSAKKAVGPESFSYVDKQILSGTHEYCIAYYVDGKDTYLMTETQFTEVNTVISPVSEVRYLGARKEEVSDPENGSVYEATFVTLEWDKPVADIDPLYYNISVDMKSLIVMREITETKAEFSIGTSDEARVWITTVYTTGSIISSAFDIVATDIKPVKGSHMIVNTTGGKLSVNEKCSSIKVFDVNGKEVVSGVATSEVDINSLAKGIYVVNIESATGRRSIKFVK